ncbi:unnamed protein product [Dovyalis caffra]|uniref:CCHC-type domain-containing protein n=1 Tax=Dovyalis caffra TaxID=77055 RepID=A0AAV1RHI3_9ROSI|nr:unnamed protein product [Dovyalis caffra]
MVKEAARKCSNCGHNGHNSRTCAKGCIKLFGVSIEKHEPPIKRSASLDNIEFLDDNNVAHHVDAGYNSDGCIGSKTGKTTYGKKKGICDSFVASLIYLLLNANNNLDFHCRQQSSQTVDCHPVSGVQ